MCMKRQSKTSIYRGVTGKLASTAKGMLKCCGFLGLCYSALAACPSGMVQSGSTCIDIYEASLWEVTNAQAIDMIRTGQVTNATQLLSLGAIQRGIGIDYMTLGCHFNGGGCKNLFAVSIAGVIPARTANYFIAAAACRNSFKRLPTNAEWQAAALGTPDPGNDDDQLTQCNVGTSGHIALAGQRTTCVSDVGAHDMIGNVTEWVGDWGPLATAGTNWDVTFGDDVSNVGGAPNNSKYYGLPAGTIRGGGFVTGSAGNHGDAGVYAIDQNGAPNSIGNATSAGFRCAK
jgi:formylglycine-generating enzyme required for sulfatase activity